MSSDIFDIGEQVLFLEERTAVDGARLQVEARQAIDVVLNIVEGRGCKGRCIVGEAHAFDFGERFFEHASLGAA